MRISDWSSDVCSSDLHAAGKGRPISAHPLRPLCGGDAGEDPSPRHIVGNASVGRRGPRRADAAISGRISRRPRLFRPGGHRRPETQADGAHPRSEEHTSELQSLMRISYAVFCLQKKTKSNTHMSTYIDSTNT